MGRAIDISGLKFGRLTAIRPTDERIDSKVVWEFLCDCGNYFKALGKSVKSGNTKSCGCYKKEQSTIRCIDDGSSLFKFCSTCKKEMKVKKSKFDRTIYCSKNCYALGLSKFFSGESNPNWKGGISQSVEHVNKRAKIWRDKNKERVRQYNRSLKVMRRGAAGRHTLDEVREIYKTQNGLCAYCKIKVGQNYHVDHIVPISKGGDNTKMNICISCPSCNLKKHNKMPEEWADQIGKLI